TYEGCPPSWDAPDEGEANREIAERFIVADPDWQDAIIEQLSESRDFRNTLLQIGATLEHGAPPVGNFNARRLFGAIRDDLLEAAIAVAPQQVELWDEAAAEHEAGV